MRIRPPKSRKFGGKWYYLDDQSWWMRSESCVVRGKVKTTPVRTVIARRKAFWKRKGAKVRVVKFAEGYAIYTRFIK